MQRFLAQLLPFIVMGMIIVLVALGLMLLAYLLIFGAIIGFVIYAVRWIRDRYFAPRTIRKRARKSGRIIDSDEWKKL